jgi:molybdopterin/thiamine biosynthesis adenylyltransferase
MALVESKQRDRTPIVRLTDGLVAAIAADLGSVAPERGGALLGFGGTVHLLVGDTKGTYGPTSWDISKELSNAVGQVEAGSHGTLMGTVHSHPRGFADPSGTDVATTTKALDLNPHLDDLVIAIVTEGTPRELDVAISATHRMSMHVLSRGGCDTSNLSRARIDVRPLCEDVQRAGLDPQSFTTVDDVLDPRTDEGSGLDSVLIADGREVISIPLPNRPNAALLIDGLYPTVSPIGVEATTDPASGRVTLSPVPSPWDPTRESAGQIRDLVQTLAPTTQSDTWSRISALVGSLAESCTVVVGAGSVGSRIAEDLTRCGVGRLTLVDPDVVERTNLARSVYTLADVGLSKTKALARRLLAINPGLQLAEFAESISDLDPSQLLSGADLLILATDDMQQQAYLAHWAYWLEIPQVACAIYRKGAAGEVVVALPEAKTPCWACAVGAQTDAAQRRPPTNYGLHGRLVAESALGPAINAISSVASQIAVGLLSGPASPAGSSLGRILAEGRTLGMISTTPEWDFFPEVFSDMGHQFQPQSVWPLVERNQECPVCGLDRREPLSGPEGSDFTRALNELVVQND